MNPAFKFVVLWEVVGILGVIIIMFLQWLDGDDLRLKEIAWGLLISLVGFFVPLMIITFLIGESNWWFRFTQKVNKLWEESGSWIIIKGRQSKTKVKE